VLAVFGWGVGFYGPPIYLHAVQEAHGWSVFIVSTAVTLHFLLGAVVVANLLGLYHRYGLPAVTEAGAISLGLGVVGGRLGDRARTVAVSSRIADLFLAVANWPRLDGLRRQRSF
jgi:hypothetical protein